MTPRRAFGAVTVALALGALLSYGMRESPKRRAPTPRVALDEPAPAPLARVEPVAVAAEPVTPATPTRPLVAPSPVPDERTIMAALRALGPGDAEQIVALARDGNALFPDSPDAPERSWTLAKALTTLGRFREARDEATLTVARYPGTTWAQDVERHLLVNPLDQPSREEQQALEREARIGE